MTPSAVFWRGQREGCHHGPVGKVGNYRFQSPGNETRLETQTLWQVTRPEELCMKGPTTELNSIDSSVRRPEGRGLPVKGRITAHRNLAGEQGFCVAKMSISVA